MKKEISKIWVGEGKARSNQSKLRRDSEPPCFERKSCDAQSLALSRSDAPFPDDGRKTARYRSARTPGARSGRNIQSNKGFNGWPTKPLTVAA
jgi:hypothetical protein